MKTTSPRRNFLGKIGLLSLGSIFPFKKKTVAFDLEGTDPTACTIIPLETRGPYPLFDASAIASQSTLIRSDIRETQPGVSLTLTITVQNVACAALPGIKVHIWHCSKDGLYSGYSNPTNPGQAGLTYLRGVQTTDASGQVVFTTIFPGWYIGRLQHIHVEAFGENVLLRTSQFAFPLDSIEGSSTALVIASYGMANNPVTSYNDDSVFNDGYEEQLLTLTGSISEGYTANQTFTLNYIPLPLHLISFVAGVENGNPMLWWITENEINIGHFEIEQSTHPSRNYKPVGTVVGFNNFLTNNYTFSLQQPLPAEITYFRLKMVSIDGSFNYSAIVTLDSKAVKVISLANSFVIDRLIIKHPAVYNNSSLKIINLSGQLIATGNLKTGTLVTSISVEQLKRGVYILIIESGIDRYVTKFYKE